MDKNSVVVITGANSGMGKATSIEIAKTGAKTVMVCRNKERGLSALEEVKTFSENNLVYLMICDLSSIESIEEFCCDFKKQFKRLDVLINNAGVILPSRHETYDGYELQFGVNHLGHFLLTNRLIEVVKASAPSRIINVSSGAHKVGKIHFQDINLNHNFRFWRAYAQSKLANILFTYELSRRLTNTNVTVNCLHPGAVATDMGINRDTGFGRFITRLLKPFFQTPLQGADTAIYLATSKEVEGITGKYFYNKKPIASSKNSYNEDLARRLWNLSEEMVNLSK